MTTNDELAEAATGAGWVRWLPPDVFYTYWLLQCACHRSESGIVDEESGWLGQTIALQGGLDAVRQEPSQMDEPERLLWCSRRDVLARSGFVLPLKIRDDLTLLAALGIIERVSGHARGWRLVRPAPLPEDVLALTPEETQTEADIRWSQLFSAQRRELIDLLAGAGTDEVTTSVAAVASALDCTTLDARETINSLDDRWEADRSVADLADDEPFTLLFAPTEDLLDVVWSAERGGETLQMTVRALADELDTTVRQVQRAIDRLVRDGEITAVPALHDDGTAITLRSGDV